MTSRSDAPVDRARIRASDGNPPAPNQHAATVERQLVDAVEAERGRIGREFHDGLGQRLTSMALAAAILEHKLEMAHRPEALDAHRLVSQIDEAVREARSLIRGLYPVWLAQNGLERTVEELLQRVQDVSSRRATLIVERWKPVAEQSVVMQIYRVIQEAVNNAVKHSGCSSITVHFDVRDDCRRITIEDDGRGIPEGKDAGMGIRVMQHRAELIGGRLTVGSPTGGGTIIELSLTQGAVTANP